MTGRVAKATAVRFSYNSLWRPLASASTVPTSRCSACRQAVAVPGLNFGSLATWLEGTCRTGPRPLIERLHVVCLAVPLSLLHSASGGFRACFRPPCMTEILFPELSNTSVSRCIFDQRLCLGCSLGLKFEGNKGNTPKPLAIPGFLRLHGTCSDPILALAQGSNSWRASSLGTPVQAAGSACTAGLQV